MRGQAMERAGGAGRSLVELYAARLAVGAGGSVLVASPGEEGEIVAVGRGAPVAVAVGAERPGRAALGAGWSGRPRVGKGMARGVVAWRRLLTAMVAVAVLLGGTVGTVGARQRSVVQSGDTFAGVEAECGIDPDAILAAGRRIRPR